MNTEEVVSSAPPIPQDPPAYQVNMEPPPPQYQNPGNYPGFVKSHLTDIPGRAVCPSCNLPCVTRLEYKSGCLTILLCCLMFFCGFILGCFLIPCCIKSCKDVNHRCPGCNSLIHKHKRL
ncbi:lITAF domain-containing protein [Discoglossus pictus]